MSKSVDTIHNDFICWLSPYYDRMMNAVSKRRANLQALLAQGVFSEVIKHAGRYAGRRPTWHIETGLLARVRSAGFGAFVRQFAPPKPEDFDNSLEKAEGIMVTEKRFTGNRKRLLKAAARVKSKCRFPSEKFTPVSPQFAADNQINKQSSSGFPSFRRKGQLIDTLVSEANDVFEGKNNHIWNWPMVRGFRIQIRESVGKLSRKIRVMYPYPGLIILLEDTFIVPFVEHFINTQTFYVIGKNGGKISDLLKQKFTKSKLIRGTDISSFDQNMLNEVIICAFAIIRSQLKLTKVQALVFDNLVTYFCTSTMVSKSKGKPSYMFVKDHGIPSGSGFTNMIGSLCQAIIVEYVQEDLLDDCLICGDDNLFVADKVNYTHYCHTFEEIFDLPIDPVKSMVFNSWTNVYFLGFKWVHGIRTISPLLAINQTLWHPDFITELDAYDREVARAASVLLNGKNGSYYFKKIFPDVMQMLEMGIDVRFKYLYGTAPPATFEGVTGKFVSRTTNILATPGINESLQIHLDHGWEIR